MRYNLFVSVKFDSVKLTGSRAAGDSESAGGGASGGREFKLSPPKKKK